jgi:broad specificity phosphatase PhoE
MLILVRHAMPDAIPEVAPEHWSLSAEGSAAARALVAALPLRAHPVSSAEPKAWETLGGAANGVVRDPRFNEVSRVGEPWHTNFRELRRAYVEGTRHPRWEPQEQAAGRFGAALAAAQQDAGDLPVVVATHGMVMTTWLLATGVLQPSEAGEFWAGLRFPDCHVLDGGRLVRCDPPTPGPR